MVTNKVAIPSPQIFTSDPTEQIFARGTLDRDISGLAYMLYNAAGRSREQDQAAYMQGVDRANKQAAELARQELASEEAMKTLAQAVEYAKTTDTDPAAIPAIAQRLFGGGNLAAGTDAAALRRALTQAKIAHENASAAAAGQGGADKYTVTTDVSPSGLGVTTLRGQGRDPVTIQGVLEQRAEQERQRQIRNRQLYMSGRDADNARTARDRNVAQ